MFAVQLPAFEGPLDLLLHLIRKHELSVFDIPIHFITERFLAAIAEMERLDLRVGGEFLVMAATLAQLKSRLLLPRPATPDEEEEADPRDALVRQLVEYQRCKQLAAQLEAQPQLGHHVFTRPLGQSETATTEGVSSEAPAPGPLDLIRLLDAYETVRRRSGFKEGYEVLVTRRTVRQEMQRVASVLSDRRRVGFWEIVSSAGEPTGQCPADLATLVGVFLAVLELVKLGLVAVVQSVPLDDQLFIRATCEDLEGEVLAAQRMLDEAASVATDATVRGMESALAEGQVKSS